MHSDITSFGIVSNSYSKHSSFIIWPSGEYEFHNRCLAGLVHGIGLMLGLLGCFVKYMGDEQLRSLPTTLRLHSKVETHFD